MPSDKHSEVEIKRLIMAEVSRQMGPVQEVLKKLHEWQLAFWSNGSGRPPGFFQTRIKEDDRRYSEMLDEVSKLTDHKAAVDAFIIELRLAREFREKREDEDKQRRKMYWGLVWKIGGPIGTGLLALLSWGAAKATPVIKILIDDYLQAHPHAMEQIKNSASGDGDPSFAHSNDPTLTAKQ
jgi:hypothetical protein